MYTQIENRVTVNTYSIANPYTKSSDKVPEKNRSETDVWDLFHWSLWQREEPPNYRGAWFREYGYELEPWDNPETSKEQSPTHIELNSSQGNSVNSSTEDMADDFQYSGFTSVNRTDFEITSDTSYEERKKLERLRSLNNGNFSNHENYGMDNHQFYSEKAHIIDKARRAQAMCNYCDLTSKETEYVVRAAKKLNFDKLGYYSSMEIGIIAIMACVVERRRPLYGGDLETSHLHRNARFTELMGQNDLTTTQLFSVKRIVGEEIGNFLSKILK
jgi:hypothetical protein